MPGINAVIVAGILVLFGVGHQVLGEIEVER